MKLILITINNLAQFSTVKALKKRTLFLFLFLFSTIKEAVLGYCPMHSFTFKCSCGLSAEQV